MKVKEVVTIVGHTAKEKALDAKDYIVEHAPEITTVLVNCAVGVYIGSVCYGIGNLFGYVEGFDKGQEHVIDIVQRTNVPNLPGADK